MLYYDFKDTSISRLGFGAMRLPVIDGDAGNIDKAATQALIDKAIECGINYFDTAYSYHLGFSESVLGECLSKHPRDSYYITSKFPGHEHRNTWNPGEIFQEQLDRCGVEYFDFYLAHNVTELSIDSYMDKNLGMIDMMIAEKAAGRIKHLGFSSHGRLDTIKRFMDEYGEHMEFCQLEVNYLDWTLQESREKYEYLTSLGLPIWVMEPVRGGKLVNLGEEATEKLHAYRPDESTAAWAFRWLQRLDNVGVVLSGMNSIEMIEENAATFSEQKPLTDEEAACIEGIAQSFANFIPCTACRYCTKHCPLGLDIPNLLTLANDALTGTSYNVTMGIESLPEDKKPGACLKCGACAAVCPQNIDIPSALETLQTTADKLTPWHVLRHYD